jgi:hypothetical protein
MTMRLSSALVKVTRLCSSCRPAILASAAKTAQEVVRHTRVAGASAWPYYAYTWRASCRNHWGQAHPMTRRASRYFSAHGCDPTPLPIHTPPSSRAAYIDLQ